MCERALECALAASSFGLVGSRPRSLAHPLLVLASDHGPSLSLERREVLTEVSRSWGIFFAFLMPQLRPGSSANFRGTGCCFLEADSIVVLARSRGQRRLGLVLGTEPCVPFRLEGRRIIQVPSWSRQLCCLLPLRSKWVS